MRIFQIPAGFSAQVWTDMNAQLLKPSLEESPFRSDKSMVFVFMGEVRLMWRSPRRE